MARNFEVMILAPREVKGGDTIPVRAVTVPLDSKTPMRKEMAELIRDLLTKSYDLGTLDHAVLAGLGAILDGKGMFEHNIGEFFLLYGRFEERYQCDDGKQTREKMDELLGEDRHQYLKRYKDRKGIVRLHALPYVVRNILAHRGRNPNKLDENGQEIRTSIELLRKWMSD